MTLCDLVSGIGDRIAVALCWVCPSWRSASRSRVPLLLVPSQLTSVNRRLWSLSDDSVVDFAIPAALDFSFLFASPRGWMLGVASHDLSAKLLHPFTCASKSLPPLPPSFRDDAQKIIRDMVWDRSPDAIVVSPGKDAFFCRLRPCGGGSWSPVAGCSPVAGRFSSITYCDGTFYLLEGKAGRVMAVDGTTFAVAAVIEPPDMVSPPTYCGPEYTLVIASPGELLLIVRTSLLFEVLYHSSEGFLKVFRADVRSPAAVWSEVADGSGIGDRAVFVDHLRAFCVEAGGVKGVRRNCIYVARGYEAVDDDYGMDVYAKFTVSVLDLADLTTTENPEHGNLRKCRDGRLWQWPSWSMPNLH